MLTKATWLPSVAVAPSTVTSAVSGWLRTPQARPVADSRTNGVAAGVAAEPPKVEGEEKSGDGAGADTVANRLAVPPAPPMRGVGVREAPAGGVRLGSSMNVALNAGDAESPKVSVG